MSSLYGENLKLMIFGQSHSAAIGMTMDGIPAGHEIDMDKLAAFMERRAPGRDRFSTQRKEADLPEFVSGLFRGVTCGAPITAIIRNNDTRSKDYEELKRVPRPGHADYTAEVKYHGFQDYTGGGHFSGRLTAPLCIAGDICLQILEKEGITVSAKVVEIAGETNEDAMRAKIDEARENQDSVGGIVECTVNGLPVGLGDPMFGGMENRIA